MAATTESKRSWAMPVRLAVSVALLGLLFWRLDEGVDWTHLLPTWSLESLAELAGAAILMLASYLLATVRWREVAHALALSCDYRRLLSHLLAGQFVSNALPTTIGGDFVRVARLAKDSGDGPGSFASVVLERLTGWIVLPAITLAGFALDREVRAGGTQTRATIGIALVTLGGLVGLLWLVNHPRVGGRFTEGEGWRRFATAVHLGVGRIRRHPGALGSILGAGLVYQMVLVAAAYLAALALDIQIGFTSLMAFFPAVLIVQVIPVSIAGLGVREATLVWLLDPLGVPREKALALGLLIWVITVVTSLAGAPSFAMGGRAAARPSEVLA